MNPACQRITVEGEPNLDLTLRVLNHALRLDLVVERVLVERRGDACRLEVDLPGGCEKAASLLVERLRTMPLVANVSRAGSPSA